tara:strand:+ start:619 stop:999 length:381 start_codon:yes stop_codon:yes gene_type:complete
MNINTSTTHKECPHCKEIKDRKLDFYHRKSEKIKVSSYCKSCIKASNLKRSRDNKQKGVDYLGGKCTKCGYNKCNAALDFHHTDSTTKEFSPAHLMRSTFDKLKSELDKCVLLCANCHREHHSSDS